MDPSSLGRLRVVAGRVFIAQLPVHRCSAGHVFITQRPAHRRSAVSLVNHAATTAAVGARTGRSTNVEAAHVSDHNMTGATGSPPARSLALGFISAASPCDGSAPKTATAMADQGALHPAFHFPSNLNSIPFISCMQEINGRGKRPLHARMALTLT